MYSVKILKDSICNGRRIVTWELTYPRFVHAELMTHRLFSRNSASSRAIPNKKLREKIKKGPVMPVYWGQNKSGMQAGGPLSGIKLWLAQKIWRLSRWPNLLFSWVLSKMGVHKQLCNRLLEPHMFITVLVTTTEHDNWFKLRAHKDAQPEIAKVAYEMQTLYKWNKPEVLKPGQWHAPFCDVQPDEDQRKICVARCARLSYLTHNGDHDPDKDIELHNHLLKAGHMSPFEHVAQAADGPDRWSGNFRGWIQYRELVDRDFMKRENNDSNA